MIERDPLKAHRAPEPHPADEPIPEPAHPHHPPIPNPEEEQPVPDHNPSIERSAARRSALRC